MVPFVPFVALVGKAVYNASTEDAALLQAALVVMRPVAASSPHVKSIVKECDGLLQITSTLTSSCLHRDTLS